MPMPVASTIRSPRRSTSRPPPSAETSRIRAKTEMTAPAWMLSTPKSLANTGMAGATMPNPRATAEGDGGEDRTSGGSCRHGFPERPPSAGRVAETASSGAALQQPHPLAALQPLERSHVGCQAERRAGRACGRKSLTTYSPSRSASGENTRPPLRRATSSTNRAAAAPRRA